MCGNPDKVFSTIKGGIIGFSLGLIVGALAALFLATKTGEELRADVKRIAVEIRDQAEEKAGKIKDLTKDKYEDIVNAVIVNYKKVRDFTEKEIDLIKEFIMEQKDIKA
ncbi:MAG: YtxH domain-containing protein [Actinobacteria bacterium]|nr:YtxH domain-containing protein [Actinomycetota bacterium]MBE3128890.1 YtxH domain-containing protein [Actinomycetota bacterium]